MPASPNAFPKSGEEIARLLIPDLLKPGAYSELDEAFPIWWESLKPDIPQSVRAMRFEKAVNAFQTALKKVEDGKDDWRKCQIRNALAEVMWKDLSSFSDNRESERTKLTLEWLFEILSSWSDDYDEADKVNEFFVKFHLDTSGMRNNTNLTLAVRERCTQSYVDALTAFRPKRPSMIGLVRLLRIETYASLIQVASERAIQSWNLKRYKDARQILLAHESAISYAADLERDFEEAIRDRKDRRAIKWMEGLNKLVHAQDKENGYEYVFGRIAEAGGDCRAYIQRCEARSEIDLGIVMYRKALLDDPDDIIENVEDALTHLRNAALVAENCDWDLEGEALVRIAAILSTVFRRAGSATILNQKAIGLATAHQSHAGGKPLPYWYEQAERALMGKEEVDRLDNQARWRAIQNVVEGKLAEHLKPILEYEGDLKAFIEWIWAKYPPLSSGGNTLPEGMFPPTPAETAAPHRKKQKKKQKPKAIISLVSNSAYKKLVFRYHPDKGQDSYGETWKATAETIVKELNDRRDKHTILLGMV